MKVFDKVIEHDWFAENEAVARKYLAEHPEGPVRSLAQIVDHDGPGPGGHYAEALASFNALMAGLGGSDQEEFAVNFADTLATAAMAAGEHDVARKVYQALLKKFGGESPNLAQKVKDELARLDRVGKPAPSVAVNDLAGRPLRLDDFRGKYVLVDFWATWCAPCVVELPRLQAAYAKYHAKGLRDRRRQPRRDQVGRGRLRQGPQAPLEAGPQRAPPTATSSRPSASADPRHVPDRPRRHDHPPRTPRARLDQAPKP